MSALEEFLKVAALSARVRDEREQDGFGGTSAGLQPTFPGMG